MLKDLSCGGSDVWEILTGCNSSAFQEHPYLKARFPDHLQWPFGGSPVAAAQTWRLIFTPPLCIPTSTMDAPVVAVVLPGDVDVLQQRDDATASPCRCPMAHGSCADPPVASHQPGGMTVHGQCLLAQPRVKVPAPPWLQAVVALIDQPGSDVV